MGGSMVESISRLKNPKDIKQVNYAPKEDYEDNNFQYSKEKYDNSPKDPNLTYFEEDNCIGQQKRCVTNTRHIKRITTRSIDISRYKQDL